MFYSGYFQGVEVRRGVLYTLANAPRAQASRDRGHEGQRVGLKGV
jgi:hypothetical protein